MSASDRCRSLIPGLGVKLSTVILVGPTVLSAGGACPPHDGVRCSVRIYDLVSPSSDSSTISNSIDLFCEYEKMRLRLAGVKQTQAPFEFFDFEKKIQNFSRATKNLCVIPVRVHLLTLNLDYFLSGPPLFRPDAGRRRVDTTREHSDEPIRVKKSGHGVEQTHPPPSPAPPQGGVRRPPAEEKTMGIVVVAALAANVTAVPPLTIARL